MDMKNGLKLLGIRRKLALSVYNVQRRRVPFEEEEEEEREREREREKKF